MMPPTRDELGEIAAHFQSIVDYHRSMGLDELLIERGEKLEPEPVEPTTAQTQGENVSKPSLLEELRVSFEGCTKCQLHKGRKTIVFGDGDPDARLMFVGEGPGADEDRQGKPFVGAAGQLLNKIIKAIGLERNQVYIGNVVKCRPPGNRTPEQVERLTCGPFLSKQIEIIGPEVIVALGATAANYLLDEDLPMKRLRSRFHQLGDILVMPTYHPAYLLRNPSAKRAVWEDMKMVRDRLGLTS